VEDRYHQADLIEQARSDVRRIGLLVDQQHEDHARRTRILSAILGILIVLLAVGIWYSYPVLREQKNNVAQMVGLKDVADGLGNRLNAVEGKFSAQFPALASQMDRLQAEMRSNMQSARTQAQDVANQVGQRVRDDVGKSLLTIQSRLSGLESNQKETSAHVAQLEEQITKLNSDLAGLRQESATTSQELKQLKEAQQSSSQEITGLNERVVTHQATLKSLADQSERKRIDFDITDRKAAEIAPDIFFTVLRADVGRQELDAVLRFGAIGRNLPIRGQGIRKPVMFSIPGDTRPVELVISEISKNKITGYMTMPSPIKSEEKK